MTEPTTLGDPLGIAQRTGVSVIWKQRSEPDPQRNLALFEALPSGLMLRIMSGVVVLTGFLLVFSRGLWGRWWVWLSLLLLGVVWVLMLRFGGGYYNLIEQTPTQAPCGPWLSQRARGNG